MTRVLTRRGFLGALVAAPVAVPAVAKAMAAETGRPTATWLKVYGEFIPGEIELEGVPLQAIGGPTRDPRFASIVADMSEHFGPNRLISHEPLDPDRWRWEADGGAIPAHDGAPAAPAAGGEQPSAGAPS